MNATAGQAEGRSLADRFGIEPGMVVMEMGYDDDVDDDLRDACIAAGFDGYLVKQTQISELPLLLEQHRR